MAGLSYLVTSPSHKYVVVGHSMGTADELETIYRPIYGNMMEMDVYPCNNAKHVEQLFMMDFNHDNIMFDMYKKQYHHEYRDFFTRKVNESEATVATKERHDDPLVRMKACCYHFCESS